MSKTEMIVRETTHRLKRRAYGLPDPPGFKVKKEGKQWTATCEGISMSATNKLRATLMVRITYAGK